MGLPFSDTKIDIGAVGAVCGLIVAALLVSLNLYLTHILVKTVPPVLAIACLLYLFAGRGTEADAPTLPRWSVHALPSVVFLGSAVLIGLSVLTSGRGPAFYAIAFVLAVLLFVQIVFAANPDLHVGVVLAQVLALGFVVRFAALLGSAGYVGIDVWIHVPQYVEGILATNSLEGMGRTKYVTAPLYHLLVVATVLLADLPVRLALFVSLGTAMVLSVVFVYVTATILVAPRWAAFATAAYSVSDFVVVWSIHLIPTSLGLILFLAVLFLIVHFQRHDTTSSHVALIVILVIAMAFTNQVSSFILLVLFGSGSLAQILLNGEALFGRLYSESETSVPAWSIHSYTVFALGVLTFVWSVTPWGDRTFTEAMIAILWGSIEGGGLFDRSDAVGTPGVEEATLLSETIIPLIDHLGFLFLLFGTVLGSLYVLQRDRTNQAKLTLIVATVVMSTFTLLPPLFGLSNLLPSRWFAFLYAPMGLLSGIGFARLHRNGAPQAFAVVALSFALLFSGGMLFATDATQDAPAFPEENSRYSYTPTEMSAVETILEITMGDEDDPIYTDHPYTTVLNRYGGEERFDIASVGDDPPDHDTILYRDYQTTGAPQFEDDEGNQRVQRVSAAEMCGTRSIGYDNGDVTLCTR